MYFKESFSLVLYHSDGKNVNLKNTNTIEKLSAWINVVAN